MYVIGNKIIKTSLCIGIFLFSIGCKPGGGATTSTDTSQVTPTPTPAPTPNGQGGSAPTVRQYTYIDTQGSAGTLSLTATFSQPTLAGSTTWAITRSAADGNPTPNLIASFTASGTTFVALGNAEDRAGAVNVVSGHAYAANVPAGITSVTGTYNAYDDYRSIILVEITNVSTNPLIGHSENGQLTPTTNPDDLTSGNINVTDQPALLIAISCNEGQQGGAPFYPSVGAGFTHIGTTTNYGLGTDFNSLESKSITTLGNVAATFTATHNGDSHITFAAVFK
jgi:hypothetical protein